MSDLPPTATRRCRNSGVDKCFGRPSVGGHARLVPVNASPQPSRSAGRSLAAGLCNRLETTRPRNGSTSHASVYTLYCTHTYVCSLDLCSSGVGTGPCMCAVATLECSKNRPTVVDGQLHAFIGPAVAERKRFMLDHYQLLLNALETRL